jgi:hypothetical protein
MYCNVAFPGGVAFKLCNHPLTVFEALVDVFSEDRDSNSCDVLGSSNYQFIKFASIFPIMTLELL